VVGALQLTVADCALVGGGTIDLQDAAAVFSGTDFGGRGLSSSGGGSVTVTGCSGEIASISVMGGGSLTIATSTGSIGGIAVTDSTFALDSASTATLGGSVIFSNAGDVVLSEQNFDSASLTVNGDTACSIESSNIMVGSSVAVDAGGRLTLASLALPWRVLILAVDRMTGLGSSLVLQGVSVPNVPGWENLSGRYTVDSSMTSVVISPTLPRHVGHGHDIQDAATDSFGHQLVAIPTAEPPGFAGRFETLSGPCEVAAGQRCVGRPSGYAENEACTINVIAGGALGASPIFLTVDYGGWVESSAGTRWIARRDTLIVQSSGEIFSGPAQWPMKGEPGSHPGIGTGAPQAGTVLETGDTLVWTSGPDSHMATYGDPNCCEGQALPPGGAGWMLCFA
jgi:hypothetical protein